MKTVASGSSWLRLMILPFVSRLVVFIPVLQSCEPIRSPDHQITGSLTRYPDIPDFQMPRYPDPGGYATPPFIPLHPEVIPTSSQARSQPDPDGIPTLFQVRRFQSSGEPWKVPPVFRSPDPPIT